MKSFPVLHSSRCTLSAVTQKDIPMLREILDDTNTQRFLFELCQEFQTAESLLQFIASFNNYLAQDEGFLWGIRLHLAPTLIGFIAIMDMPDNPTLFFAMHPDNRKRGYMKESIASTIKFAHNNNLCSKLYTEVYRDNSISQGLLTKIGFQHYKIADNKNHYWYNVEFNNTVQ